MEIIILGKTVFILAPTAFNWPLIPRCLILYKSNHSDSFEYRPIYSIYECPFYKCMMTSSNGNILDRVTGPLWIEPSVTGGSPSQRPVTRSFDVFFNLRLNKGLSKHSRCRWFETPSCSSWRHCSGVAQTWLHDLVPGYWPHQCQVTRHIRYVCFTLTHCGRVTHICVSDPTIIGSDNGLSPGRRQAIIWFNAGSLLIGRLGKNFSEILIEILIFSFKKMRLKVSSAKWRPFGLGLNVLKGTSDSCYWWALIVVGTFRGFIK